MKKIVTLLSFLMLGASAFSQIGNKKDSADKMSFLSSSTGNGSIVTFAQPKYRFLLVGPNAIKALYLGDKGEVFYKPSLFCSCDSCQNYEGLKKFNLEQ